jgi:SH3-like domain-containing protein
MVLPRRVDALFLILLLLIGGSFPWVWQACAQGAPAGEGRAKAAAKIVGLAPDVMLRLREAPSFDAKVIAYIPNGTDQLLFDGECDERWCRLVFRGITGWASRKHLDVGPVDVGPVDFGPVQAAVTPGETGAGALSLALAGVDFYRLSVPGGGEGIAMHRAPGPRSPVLATIPASVGRIENAGPCANEWCPVRFNGMEGWVPASVLARDGRDDEGAQRAAVPVPSGTPAKADVRVVKRYAIAGVLANSALPIRSGPDADAQMLGAIPANATDVEGLGDCRAAWCLVRHGGVEGWVARHHLADNTVGDASLRVVNLDLAEALPVMETPATEARPIGQIPAHANGVVRIGECGRDWCHVRYLGLTGWVNGRNVAPGN